MGFCGMQRFGRDGAESTTKAYAHAIALFLRWCARTGRSLAGRGGAVGPVHDLAGPRRPARRGVEAVGGAGRGAGRVRAREPARVPSRINGVLTAVRGMVVHAVATGQAPAGLVSLLYEVADDRDLPAAARGEDGRMAWRMRARHRLREPETAVDRASDERDRRVAAGVPLGAGPADRVADGPGRAAPRRGVRVAPRRCASARRFACGWGARSPRAHLHVVRRETTRTGRGRSPAGSGWCRWISWWCRRSTPTSSSGCGCRRPRAATSCWSTCSAADRRADAAGRDRRAGGRGIAPGRAGPPGPPAPAATCLRQQRRRRRAAASTWSLTCSGTLGLLVAGVHASRPGPAAGRGGRGAQPPRAGRGEPVTAAASKPWRSRPPRNALRVRARVGRRSLWRRGRAPGHDAGPGVPGRGRMGSARFGCCPCPLSIGCWAGRCAGSAAASPPSIAACPGCATDASPG